MTHTAWSGWVFDQHVAISYRKNPHRTGQTDHGIVCSGDRQALVTLSVLGYDWTGGAFSKFRMLQFVPSFSMSCEKNLHPKWYWFIKKRNKITPVHFFYSINILIKRNHISFRWMHFFLMLSCRLYFYFVVTRGKMSIFCLLNKLFGVKSWKIIGMRTRPKDQNCKM